MHRMQLIDAKREQWARLEIEVQEEVEKEQTFARASTGDRHEKFD